MIEKLLIANRGEIAVRIHRAAHKLGIKTVQVYSSVDADLLAIEYADEAIELESPAAAKSYLDIDAIICAAEKTNADAIHPGYGFLAENADFADAVEQAGKTFVGPKGYTIRTMGNKVSARNTARQAGIPAVPGSNGLIECVSAAKDMAIEIGFPVMIKASAGGGGRGIRVIEEVSQFNQLASQAATEAEAVFGIGDIYLEKLIERARHIEVQVLGDGNHFVHCFDRECSLQRRRQKIWEEAPSIALTDSKRSQICKSAVALARQVEYSGAGTVEFLYDDDSGKFYFIEMNTRIQVEHPVTEYILGIDLVAEMISIAAGEPLALSQSDLAINGHSIEVRINAEDPANDFMPFPGTVEQLCIPDGPGVRVDHMLYPGYAISPFYDSLLGKVIVWANDRENALIRLKKAISELRIDGLATTIPLFSALVDDADVRSGSYHTGWLEQWLQTNASNLSPAIGGATV